MEKNICFFNHFHNGDLFNSRPFVKEIMSKVPARSYLYAHGQSHMILHDLEMTYIPIMQLSQIPPQVKMAESEDTYFINTWIGAYFEPDGECTLRFSHGMYKKVYALMNEHMGTNLKLGPIEDYWPTVDYSKYDTNKVNHFLSMYPKEKTYVLVSNGPCNSNQCSYNDDMKELIIDLAERNKDKIFLATHKFQTVKDNIIFTDNITQTQVSDLNEISYLSTFCKAIIGRSSGPYSFSITKENVNDANKSYFCFGGKATDCFQHDMKMKCRFKFHKFETVPALHKDLINFVEAL